MDEPPVDTYISLGTPQYGTETVASCWLVLKVCRQMFVGSPYLGELNQPDDTPHDDIEWVSMWSEDDLAVIPQENGALRDGAEVVRVQDICPDATVGHGGLLWNPIMHRLVTAALGDGPITTTCDRPEEPIVLPNKPD